jgi:Restriction endonuclease
VPNANTEYEMIVRDIQETLLKAQGLESIKVLHDVKLKDSYGNERQFDVYWEYKIGGFLHKIVIECKNYKSQIKPEKVDALVGKLSNFPGIQGIIVTSSGYTSGAINLAKFKGIGLRIIRSAIAEDYTGRIRKIHFRGFIHYKDQAESVNINPDESWVLQNFSDEEIEKISELNIVIRGDTTKIWDKKLNQTLTFDEIFNDLPVPSLLGVHDKSQVFNHTFFYDDAYLMTPDLREFKVSSIDFAYCIFTNVVETTVGGDLANHIVKDAIDGHVLFIDEEGLISGDKSGFGL